MGWTGIGGFECNATHLPSQHGAVMNVQIGPFEGVTWFAHPTIPRHGGALSGVPEAHFGCVKGKSMPLRSNMGAQHAQVLVSPQPCPGRVTRSNPAYGDRRGLLEGMRAECRRIRRVLRQRALQLNHQIPELERVQRNPYAPDFGRNQVCVWLGVSRASLVQMDQLQVTLSSQLERIRAAQRRPGLPSDLFFRVMQNSRILINRRLLWLATWDVGPSNAVILADMAQFALDPPIPVVVRAPTPDPMGTVAQCRARLASCAAACEEIAFYLDALRQQAATFSWTAAVATDPGVRSVAHVQQLEIRDAQLALQQLQARFEALVPQIEAHHAALEASAGAAPHARHPDADAGTRARADAMYAEFLSLMECVVDMPGADTAEVNDGLIADFILAVEADQPHPIGRPVCSTWPRGPGAGGGPGDAGGAGAVVSAVGTAGADCADDVRAHDSPQVGPGAATPVYASAAQALRQASWREQAQFFANGTPIAHDRHRRRTTFRDGSCVDIQAYQPQAAWSAASKGAHLGAMLLAGVVGLVSGLLVGSGWGIALGLGLAGAGASALWAGHKMPCDAVWQGYRAQYYGAPGGTHLGEWSFYGWKQSGSVWEAVQSVSEVQAVPAVPAVPAASAAAAASAARGAPGRVVNDRRGSVDLADVAQELVQGGVQEVAWMRWWTGDAPVRAPELTEWGQTQRARDATLAAQGTGWAGDGAAQLVDAMARWVSRNDTAAHVTDGGMSDMDYLSALPRLSGDASRCGASIAPAGAALMARSPQ